MGLMVNFQGKIGKILQEKNILFISIFIAMILVSGSAKSQRRDDAVTAGTSRGSSKFSVATKPAVNEDLNRARHFYKNEIMVSSQLYYRQQVGFGPFLNKSKYNLMISLTHTGSQATRFLEHMWTVSQLLTTQKIQALS